MRYKSLPTSVRASRPSWNEPPAAGRQARTPSSGARRAANWLATLPILLLLPALALPFLGASAAVPDPKTCAGYPEPRVFLESQDWWTLPGDKVEGMSRHVHTATCFPWKQSLSGVVDFDVQVQLHDNPGTLTRVDVQIFGDAGGVMAASKSLSIRCADDTCSYWFHLEADTAKYQYDGRQEFRVHAYVTSPDGTKGRTSSGWQAYLANGHPVNDYRSSDNFTESRGWYTDAGYTNARLTTAIPARAVSGVWTFGVKLAPGSGGAAVTHSLVTVDPKFHASPPDRGLVIKEAGGPYTGSVSLDTTRLSNGVHKLFLRADARISGGTNSGAEVILFTVSN